MRSAPAAASRDGLQVDPARHLDRNAATDELDGRGHLGGAHVVDSTRSAPAAERHLHLVEGVALHLDGQGGPAPLGHGDGRLDGDAGQVVVLERGSRPRASPGG